MRCIACGTILMAMVTLAGCTTARDAKKKSPTSEVMSSMSSKVVAACLYNNFEKTFKSGVNSRPTATGYSVWKEDTAGLVTNVGLVVDIDDTANGSSLKFYANGALSSAIKKTNIAIEECK